MSTSHFFAQVTTEIDLPTDILSSLENSATITLSQEGVAPTSKFPVVCNDALTWLPRQSIPEETRLSSDPGMQSEKTFTKSVDIRASGLVVEGN